MPITYYPIYKAKVRETLFEYWQQLREQLENNDAPSSQFTKIFGTNSGVNGLTRLIDFMSSTIAMIDYIDSKQLLDEQKFEILRGALITALNCAYKTPAYQARAQVEYYLARSSLLWQAFKEKLAAIDGPTSVQLSTMPTFHLVARLVFYTQLIDQFTKQAKNIRIDNLLTTLLSSTVQEDEQELLQIMLALYREGIYDYLKNYATADQHFYDAYENYELFGFIAIVGKTTGLNYTTPKADEAVEVYYQFCRENKPCYIKTAEGFKIKEIKLNPDSPKFTPKRDASKDHQKAKSSKKAKAYVPPHKRDPRILAADNMHSWHNRRKQRGVEMHTKTTTQQKGQLLRSKTTSIK